MPFFNKSVSLQVGNFTVAIEKKSYQQWRLKNREWIEVHSCKDSSIAREIIKLLQKTTVLDHSVSMPQFTKEKKVDNKKQCGFNKNKDDFTLKQTQQSKDKVDESDQSKKSQEDNQDNLDTLTQEQFRNLFDPLLERGRQKLKGLPVDSLYKINKYFSKKHWKMLSADQINAYAVDKITSKEQFDGIFDVDDRYKWRVKLQSLSMSSLYKISSYLSDEHWQELSADQIKAYDIDKITSKEQFDSLFDVRALFNTLAKEKLQGLPVDSLYKINKYFSKEHWESLSLSQIKKYDMDKLTKEQFNCLFSGADEILLGEDKKQKLRVLSSESIYKINKYFSKKHWQALSVDQLKAYDMSKLTKEQFENIFNGYSVDGKKKIQVLPLKTLYQIDKYFVLSHWISLSPEQLLHYDDIRIKNIPNKGTSDFIWYLKYGKKDESKQSSGKSSSSSSNKSYSSHKSSSDTRIPEKEKDLIKEAVESFNKFSDEKIKLEKLTLTSLKTLFRKTSMIIHPDKIFVVNAKRKENGLEEFTQTQFNEQFKEFSTAHDVLKAYLEKKK